METATVLRAWTPHRADSPWNLNRCWLQSKYKNR